MGEGGGGDEGGEGRGLEGHCSQSASRHQDSERETEVRGFGGRQAGRQADWKEHADSQIRA